MGEPGTKVDKGKGKQKTFLESLSHDQQHLFYEAEFEKIHTELAGLREEVKNVPSMAKQIDKLVGDIAQLYDITRGIISWPRVKALITWFIGIVSLIVALGIAKDTTMAWIVNLNDRNAAVTTLTNERKTD
jgi:tetrahydromethanopterin S-methyltransferase subunit G